MAKEGDWPLHGLFFVNSLLEAKRNDPANRLAWNKKRLAEEVFDVSQSTLNRWGSGEPIPVEQFRIADAIVTAQRPDEEEQVLGASQFRASFDFLRKFERGKVWPQDGIPAMAREFLLREERLSREAPAVAGSISPSCNVAAVDEIKRQAETSLPEMENTHVEPRKSSALNLPYRLPDFVSENSAFAADPVDAIWLNPHNHHSIPLCGRDDEWALLETFINDEQQFLVAALVAPSGAGKTRLVSQWMRQYTDGTKGAGWDAGFVESRDPDLWSEENWTPTSNTLIIVDYTYNYGEVMGAIIDRFKNGAPYKIRLLVLDHVLPEKLHNDAFWKHGIPSQKFREGKDHIFFAPLPIELSPATDKSQYLREVIAAAADPYRPIEEKRYKSDHPVVVNAANALMAIGDVYKSTASQDDLRKRDAIRHPLFAALIGQALYKNPDADFLGMSRRDLISHYFESAERIPWHEESPYVETLGHWVGLYVTVATLLRGIEINDILEFQDELPAGTEPVPEGGDFDFLIDVCGRFVSSADRQLILPFEPDILGEAFIIKYLTSRRTAKDCQNFAAAVSFFCESTSLEDPVGSFLETIQRLVRNLINDDQRLADVKAAWSILVRFLDPKWFSENSELRLAISIAIGDILKQLRSFGMTAQMAPFSERIEIADLVTSSRGRRWAPSAVAAVHCLDFLIETKRLDKSSEEKLVDILYDLPNQSQARWSGLMLSARESCLNVAKILGVTEKDQAQLRNAQNWTPLMIASETGNLEFATWLISEGVALDASTTGTGWTALMVASANGHAKVVKLLLESGADPCQHTVAPRGKISESESALTLASAAGQIGVTRELKNHGLDVSKQIGGIGPTPLMAASKSGQVKMIDALIEMGADVNEGQSGNGWTPLLTAIAAKRIASIEKLIDVGADVDQAKTDGGWTPLLAAVRSSSVEIVNLILNAGAKANKGMTSTGWTPLLAASAAGNLRVAKLLINSGADVNLGTSGLGWIGMTSSGYDDPSSFVAAFMSSFLRADNTEHIGWTPLMAACREGHDGMVQLLVQSGCDVNSRTEDDGRTALMTACLNGHVVTAKCLIDAGADPSFTTYDGALTALSIATESKNSDLVQLIKSA